MKLALLLPGYLESPDYLHLKIIDNRLQKLGYTTQRIDPCNLWKTGDVEKYTVSNYLAQIRNIIDSHKKGDPSEIVLIGHSLGASVAILAGSKYSSVTKAVCLSPTILFDKSDSKWNKNNVRSTKKDIPGNPQEFREFNIPISFVNDRKKYSVTQSLRDFNKPLMVLIASEDTAKEEIENAVREVKNSYIVLMENMGHDFRQSVEQCNLVADEIERFLKT